MNKAAYHQIREGLTVTADVLSQIVAVGTLAAGTRALPLTLH